MRAASVSHKGHSFVKKMTTALNEAYGVVRERQLRTLERNKRYQLGLPSSATHLEVEQALAKRPIPGFHVGDLVSYWQPEIKDTGINHVVPKKFQYRWNGPFPVLEREDVHYYVEIKGKRTLVNPGRLRKYYTWVNDPWEQEEEQERRLVAQMDTGEVETGDLVVVALTTHAGNSRPFAVGRVSEVSETGIYQVHWMGNTTGQLEGTYRPEWRVYDRGKLVRIYYSQRDEGDENTHACTSESVGQTIRRKNILHFGFQLVYDDRLPTELKRKMHENSNIKWSIPKE